ncbi:uncharacterized protein K452DRAFT_136939 [Aplosporella prunicola CBS 121167]|uniref:Secreted protein n=1 Tax=Aplosporella prunicola CBS 121167 TaxID=1176127 RepID=A0A6A6BMF6_9PEZI|nr:uncharacterized protein K452DRAFT_136939 [Aplosporella prunicola CBS 121167]KAF2145236.1 hypothetical protein K452DRAFT_136939 [Aplosporella prunicola CBS 121167]
MVVWALLGRYTLSLSLSFPPSPSPSPLLPYLRAQSVNQSLTPLSFIIRLQSQLLLPPPAAAAHLDSRPCSHCAHTIMLCHVTSFMEREVGLF